jgi:hypothetical protein
MMETMNNEDSGWLKEEWRKGWMMDEKEEWRKGWMMNGWWRGWMMKRMNDEED